MNFTIVLAFRSYAKHRICIYARDVFKRVYPRIKIGITCAYKNKFLYSHKVRRIYVRSAGTRDGHPCPFSTKEAWPLETLLGKTAA